MSSSHFHRRQSFCPLHIAMCKVIANEEVVKKWNPFVIWIGLIFLKERKKRKISSIWKQLNSCLGREQIISTQRQSPDQGHTMYCLIPECCYLEAYLFSFDFSGGTAPERCSAIKNVQTSSFSPTNNWLSLFPLAYLWYVILALAFGWVFSPSLPVPFIHCF